MSKGEAFYGTPDDPAWPRGCTATLISFDALPSRGLRPTIGAHQSVMKAKAAAEKDCGVRLEWSEHVGGRGQREYQSNDVIRKGCDVFYAIWDWSSGS